MAINIPSRIELNVLSDNRQVLREHMRFVERQMEQVPRQQEEALQRRLNALGTAESQEELAEKGSIASGVRREHRKFVEETLPRMVVNPFVVAVWGVYQYTVPEIAERLREERGAEKRFGSQSGDYFVDRVRRYFDDVLHLASGLDEETECQHGNGHAEKVHVGNQIEKISRFRNAITHGPGLIEDLDSDSGELAERMRAGKIEGAREAEGTYLGSRPFVLDVTFARRSLAALEANMLFLKDRYSEVSR